MSDAGRGLPLLSGPPPQPNAEQGAEGACRKCSKEFNIIFSRSRRCNHCGYSYCHSCTDYQALMPRSGSERQTGYDVMPVCAFCIEFLTITAAGRTKLKSMSLGKLKEYMTAYNIKIDRAVEKDDIIDGLLAVRGANGCLARANENFYRKYSVPNKVPLGRPRGLFSRPGQSSNGGSAPPPPPRPASGPDFPRPDLEPDHPTPSQQQHSHSQPPYVPRASQPPPPSTPPRPQQQQYNAPPHSTPPRPHSAYSYAPPPPRPYPQFHTPQPPPSMPGHGNTWGQNPYSAPPPPPPRPQQYPNYNPYQQQQQQQQPPPQNHHTRPVPPRSAPQTSTQQPQPQHAPPPPSTPRPRAASVAPPPNLDQLLTMSPDSIGALSISTLKSVLFTNHVNVGQILEKGDLVKKVLVLVEDERTERGRQRMVEEREEMERVQRTREVEEMLERERRAGQEEEERRVEERERERRRAERAPRVEEVEDEDDDNPMRRRAEAETSAGDGEEARSADVERASTPLPPSSPPRPPVPAPLPPKAQAMVSSLERTGLCVVCQDEEANIAIVDCGHLAMCRGCSDLIMSSSRECPLCRTRIVTEARLLRIYKT
ncbi:hypothetical protein B0H34DRAFT_789767 [Crassisporium funariophilum]|nr:hypothetical protein B0H34DRAFT_789767 [Crassisporium funariophilum]